MTDPRRPTIHQDGEVGNRIAQIVMSQLHLCTARGTAILRCSGVSFVTMGIGVWAADLAKTDGVACARFLRALADILDPESSEACKQSGEVRRQIAVRKLHEAVDIEISRPAGSA